MRSPAAIIANRDQSGWQRGGWFATAQAQGGTRYTAERLARVARISRRALSYAESGRAGRTVLTKITTALARLEAGETLEEHQHVIRLELRPGVWVTVEADDAATVGDLREVETKIRRLIEDSRES